MSTRLAAAALALSLAAPATAALAQGFPHAAHLAGQSVYILNDDDVDVDVTGAITPRSPDWSAKAGNAARPELATPNLGNTSGGPAY
ncbi:hypothetical protein [Methylobacterium sp. B4]|uniref:hypothetical protein n=1 Tax=Methylobacterium sp. B4 TaxID=1938755 RepID=UPI000D770CFF|nr:hypothetical protein [Methylobacterium sp. B4]PXW53280.1 hypothetical protein BY998_12521 [Methylobacterium sp. B4]